MKTSTQLLFYFFFVVGLSAQTTLDWQETGGPFGSGPASLQANENYLFASTGGSFFRCDGSQWEKLPINALFPIVVHKDTLIAIQQGTEMAISFDNGENWTNYPLSPDHYHLRDLVFTTHGLYALSGDTQDFFHSTDFGQSWTSISLPGPVNNNSNYLSTYDNRLYLRNGNTLYRTDVNGNNWAEITPPQTPTASFGILYAESPHLIVEGIEGIFLSHDDGQNWTFKPQSTFPKFRQIFPAPNGLYFFHDNGAVLSFSDDYAESFTLINDEPPFYSLATARGTYFQGQVLINSYNKGILVWDELSGEFVSYLDNLGLSSALVYEMTSSEDRIWAACGNGVFGYNSTTETWEITADIPLPKNEFNKVFTNDDGVVLAHAFLDTAIYISMDNGQQWSMLELPELSSLGLEYAQLVDSSIFFPFHFDTYVTTDFGESYQTCAPSFYNSPLAKANGILISNETIEMLASLDGGLTWSTSYEVPQTTVLNIVQSIASVEGLFFATMRREINGQLGIHLYTSVDGAEWHYAQSGLPLIPGGGEIVTDPYAFKVFRVADKIYLNAFENGLFVSLDEAQTWLPVVLTPLSKSMVYQDGYLYRGLHGVQRAVLPNSYGDLMQGLVYLDANNNGLFDTGEAPLPNMGVSINMGTPPHLVYSTLTNNDGNYVLGGFANQADTIRPFVPSSYLEDIQPAFYLTNSSTTEKDFAVQLTPDITDLSCQVFTTCCFRPGFDEYLYVQYLNEGTIPSDGKLSLTLDPNLELLSAEPAPDEVFGDSLVWNYANLTLFQSGQVQVHLQVPEEAELGTPLSMSAYVLPDQSDFMPQNNWVIFQDTIVGSYDPNDKQVSPTEGLTAAQIEAGERVTYTVRFQNTGTFYAERVRITDQLDTALYYPSLRLEAASHSVSSFELKPGGLLEIIFEEIFLPDSTSNEAESHGFVSFSIQRKQPYNAAVPVRNAAAIFFDFNDPIFTNEVSFLVPQPEVIVSTNDPWPDESGALKLFPNPVQDQLHVLIPTTEKEISVLIFDVLGRKVVEETVVVQEGAVLIEVQQLHAGIYSIFAGTQSGLFMKK